MKKNLIKTLAIALIGFSVFTVTKVDVKAITQDEMAELVRKKNEKYGINTDDCRTTGGTANDKGGEALTKKMEEIHRQEVNGNTATTTEPAPAPVEQPKAEVKPIKVEKEKPCSHEYKEEITTKPTCIKDGVKTFTCNICGDTYTTPIQALGHTEGEWEVIKESTCTEKGMKEQKCSVCDEVLNTEELDMIEHSASEWEIKAKATLTHTGAEVQKCIVCSTVLGEREIPINMTTWYIIIGVIVVVITITVIAITKRKHKQHK